LYRFVIAQYKRFLRNDKKSNKNLKYFYICDANLYSQPFNPNTMYSKQILWFCLFPLALAAQNTQWKKSYRTLGNLSNPTLVQASDSGFIFHAVRQNNTFSKYYWVNIASNGTITAYNWDPKPVNATRTSRTWDNGNLFLTYQDVPYDRPEHQEYYPLILFPITTLHKQNRHQITEWIKKYPDTLLLFNATQTLDSNYLVHGRSYRELQFFQKLDPHGNLIWQTHRNRDTLSEWLDPSTIEILSSNPACIWELVDGSILQIQVLDALLPNQYGFVKFRVKPKANIPKNTLIQHRASLFLNFEPPISIRSQMYWQRN
jgi:hypothetical protein